MRTIDIRNMSITEGEYRVRYDDSRDYLTLVDGGLIYNEGLIYNGEVTLACSIEDAENLIKAIQHLIERQKCK